jgi:hypothetical protein
MRRRVAWLLLSSLIGACAGIPLGSVPRLLKLQDDILNASPPEVMVAIQVDARLVPPAGGSPELVVRIQPAQPGTFEGIDRSLPMKFAVASTNALGLETPSPDRRWLVYSLTAESQAELSRIQDSFRRLKMQPSGNGGVRVGVGIAQEGVAVRDPALSDTRWDTWLQTSRQEGFYEIWSGTIAQLLKAGKGGA